MTVQVYLVLLTFRALPFARLFLQNGFHRERRRYCKTESKYVILNRLQPVKNLCALAEKIKTKKINRIESKRRESRLYLTKTTFSG